MKANLDPGPRRVQLTVETSTTVALLQGMDATDAARVYADAVLGDDDAQIRALGTAALQRVRSLSSAQPAHQGSSHLDGIRRDLESRVGAWTSSNSSPGDRVRALDTAIADRERQLDAAHRHTLKFAGLT